VGKRLAKYRRLANLSAQQLSDRIGGELSRGVIANIESGRKTDLTIDQLISLAWALEVPFVALALPIDEPFRWIRVLEGQSPEDDNAVKVQSMRAAELMGWMLTNPEPFSRERAGKLSPGGALARSIIRSLRELSAIQAGVVSLAQKVAQDPEYQDVLDERLEEQQQVLAHLTELGVDLNSYKIDE